MTITNVRKILTYLEKLERKEVQPSHKEEKIKAIVQKFLDKLKESGEKAELRRRLIAWEYRSGMKAKSTEEDPIYADIVKKASIWKKKQIFSQGQSLNTKELKQIAKACRYQEFAEMIQTNDLLRGRFFKWVIQNGLNPTIFILYPSLANKIRAAFLEGRLGVTQALLHDKVNQDVLVRTEEGRRFSLLKGSNKIRFRNHDCVSVDKLFKIFQKKNVKEGRLTFLGQGVSNWDPHLFGRRNGKTGKTEQVDMQSSEWFRELTYEEILTKEEAEKKFGHPCDGENWVITIAATRQIDRVTVKGAHAYLKVAIPDDQGNYRCSYGFGLFPKKYPKTFLDVIKALSCYVPATLEYPDNNHFYSHREKKMCHFSCSNEEGLELMESIRRDFLHAQENNLPFQFVVDNCTHWIIRKVKRYHPEVEELFREKFPQLKSAGILGTVVKICKKTPGWFQTSFLYSVSFLLGGWRRRSFTIEGKKTKLSLLNQAPWKNKDFIHPSIIFNKTNN